MEIFNSLTKKLKIIFASLAVVALVGIISTGVLWSKVNRLENPAEATADEIQSLVKDIGRLIVLPEDEVPTLATVSDPSKLTGQPFFQKALTGDKVLIYATSRKAILWRPSTHKIIEVSPLNVSPTAQ